MIACAAAGADVVDVAIDSALSWSCHYPAVRLLFFYRHVRFDISAVNGRRVYGPGADVFGNWYPI